MLLGISKREFYFAEPRLKMSSAGRMLVRILSYLGYLLLSAAVVVFVTSDIRWLQWFGGFLLLFLLDRVIHLHEADRPLSEMPEAGRVNLAAYLSPAAFAILERSYDRSAFARESFYLELARALADTKDVQDALRRLDVAEGEFREKCEELIGLSREKPVTREERGAQVERLVLRACQIAMREKQEFIEPGNLFSALSQVDDPFMNRLFVLFSIEPEDAEEAISFASAKRAVSGLRRLPAELGGLVFGADRGLRHRVMNRAWTAKPTPFLDKVGKDLTDRARAGQIGFLVGHKAEYERMVETLARPMSPNALLVGEAGIGKGTLIARLAFDLVRDKVPNELFDKRLVELEISSLVASAAPEELQARIQTITNEIRRAGNVILVIPDIHNLVKTSGTAYLSAADALLPIIKDSALPVIGTTFPREYKQHLDGRSDFTGAFEVIRVEEISEAEARRVLAYESVLLEARLGVFITFGAIREAVRIAKKHFHEKHLPASAEELLKSAAVRAEGRKGATVGPDEIVAAAEEKTNIPLRAADGDEAEKLLHMEDIIHERFIDQEEAVRAVCGSLRAYRSGLARTGGPIASFLFVGPTGVGKTELSKILADIQFGSKDAMVRFDMTEYQDKQSLYRFIGSPDGQVSGALTDAVRARPYSLVLLDEFEKAHPDILNLFLQVLDDGRLTDSFGRTVDFQNTIVIATSNAHSELVNQALAQGERVKDISEYVKKRLVDVFKPELLNRFSKIVVFKDLSLADVAKVAELNLRSLVAKASEQGIDLEFDASAVEQIAKWGYDPAFGARPLRRAIEEKVQGPLAEKILEGKLGRGGSLRCVAADGELRFLGSSVYVEDISAPGKK